MPTGIKVKLGSSNIKDHESFMTYRKSDSIEVTELYGCLDLSELYFFFFDMALPPPIS